MNIKTMMSWIGIPYITLLYMRQVLTRLTKNSPVGEFFVKPRKQVYGQAVPEVGMVPEATPEAPVLSAQM